MPKTSRSEQMDYKGLEIIADEFTGTFNGEITGSVDWSNIEDVPVALTAAQAAGTPSIRAIGTTATTAAAGNHTHTAATVTATAISPGTATDVQGILAELAARITDIETALESA